MVDQQIPKAMKPCRKCGHNVEVDADKCPECGTLNPAFSQSEMIGGTLALILFYVRHLSHEPFLVILLKKG